MKTLLIILSLALSTFCTAQETQQYVLANFEGMTCNGDRGVCSFEPVLEENANAVLIKNADGSLRLEIFRSKISPEEEIQLLGEEITETNKEALSFQQPEQHELEPPIKTNLGLDASGDTIENGTFSATITEETIVVQLPVQ